MWRRHAITQGPLVLLFSPCPSDLCHQGTAINKQPLDSISNHDQPGQSLVWQGALEVHLFHYTMACTYVKPCHFPNTSVCIYALFLLGKGWAIWKTSIIQFYIGKYHNMLINSRRSLHLKCGIDLNKFISDLNLMFDPFKGISS